MAPHCEQSSVLTKALRCVLMLGLEREAEGPGKKWGWRE